LPGLPLEILHLLLGLWPLEEVYPKVPIVSMQLRLIAAYYYPAARPEDREMIPPGRKLTEHLPYQKHRLTETQNMMQLISSILTPQNRCIWWVFHFADCL
jgi:hypothetical protein